jgi:hypothetical protein
MSVEIDANTITINGKHLAVNVFYAIMDTSSRQRTLWQFIEKDGEIQAVAYSERQVIWIDHGVNED